VRRDRGRRIGNPGPGPSPARKASAGLPGNPVGLPETLGGSPGCLAAPAWRRFVSRGNTLASAPPLRASRSNLEPIQAVAGRRHCWRFPGNGCLRASWSSAPNTRVILPGADRLPCEELDASHPVAGKRHPEKSGTRAASPRAALCPWMPARRSAPAGMTPPSLPPQPVIPEAEAIGDPATRASFPPSAALSGNPDTAAPSRAHQLVAGFPPTALTRSRE
jgi:hypothetical protein